MKASLTAGHIRAHPINKIPSALQIKIWRFQRVFKIRKSKKKTQYKSKGKTNLQPNLQSTTQKTKDRATRNSTKQFLIHKYI